MPHPATRRALLALIQFGSGPAPTFVITLAIAAVFGMGFIASSLAQSPAAQVAPSAVASDLPPLTLAQALALAMASNPDLAVQARELQAAQGPVVQAGARPNPELAVLLEDNRSASRTTTVQINQPLELGGKRAARISAAEHGRDIAAADLATKRADVRAAVTSMFFEVLLTQEHLALAQASVGLAQRASEGATRRVQAGKISPVEQTKAQIALASSQLDAAQTAAALTLARQRLSATWGSAASRYGVVTQVGAGFDQPAVLTPEAMARRIDASPVLMRARIEVLRREAISELARAQRVPDLTLSLGLKRDEQMGRNQAVIGMSLPLPVFDRNEGNLLEALRREDKARDELRAADIALRTSVMQGTVRLVASNAAVQMIRDQILPGAQSAYEAATRGFELGKFNFLDVLDAQRTLFQAQSAHLRARGDALRAAVELDRLLGGTDGAVVPSTSPTPTPIQTQE